MPTFRTQLRRNRTNDLAASVVGGIGEGLRGFVQGATTRRQLDLEEKARQIQQQQADQQAKEAAVIQAWRDKQQALEEKKVNALLAEDDIERKKRQDNYISKSIEVEAWRKDLTPEGYQSVLRALKAYSLSISAEKLNEKLLDIYLDDLKQQGKDKREAAKEAKAEEKEKKPSEEQVRLRAKDVISSEEKNVERLLKPHEEAVSAAFTGTPGEATAKAGLEAKRTELYEGTPTSPGLKQRWSLGGQMALEDTIRTGIPRLDAATATLRQPAPPRQPTGITTAIAKPADREQAEIEVAYPGSQDETNAKAIGMVVALKEGQGSSGKKYTKEELLADFKANPQRWTVKGITEQIILDVYGEE